MLSTLRRKIATGWVQLFSGSMLASLLNFLSFILLSRSLSVEHVGIIVIIQTYWRLIEGFLSFRSFTVLISYGAAAVASDNQRGFQHIIRTCVFADIAVAALAVITGVVGLLLFATSINIPDNFSSLAVVGGLMMLHLATGAPSGVLRLFDRFYLVAAAEVVTAVIRLVASIIGFLAGFPAAYFLVAWILAQLAGDLLLLLFGFLTLKREGYGRWLRQSNVEPGRTKVLLKSLLAVKASSMINIMSEEGDVMFVNVLLGPSSAGKYRIAKNFANIIHRLSGPLSNVIYPEIARLISSGNTLVYYKLTRDINVGCGVIAFAATIVWILLGETILRYSVGNEYVDTHSTVMIFMAAITVVFFGLCCSPTLLALQLWREIFVITLLSTAAFFATAAVLIPRYGIDGGAAGQFVCYFVEVALSLAVIRHVLKARK